MVRFDIRARAEPQTLLRLLGFIAQIGRVPALVRASEAGGIITVLIEQDRLGDQQADIIAAKMRASAMVEEVTLSRRKGSITQVHEVNS